MDQDRDLMPIRLDEPPLFEDIGMSVIGHVVSPRGVEPVEGDLGLSDIAQRVACKNL